MTNELRETPQKISGETNIGSSTSEKNRQHILQIALTEFADKGLSGARVDEIAAKTKTSKRMIYYHFGSKIGLYKAALEYSYGRIRNLETKINLDTIPPIEALQKICEFTFDYHNDHPDFVRIISNENILYGEHIAALESVRTRNRSIVKSLNRLIERGVTSGDFRSNLDAINLHMSISALCFHWVSNRHTFSKIFAWDMESKESIKERREIVCDTISRWCRALPE